MYTDEELKEIWRNSSDSRCRGFFKNEKKTIWRQARNFCVIVYFEHFESLEHFYNICANSGCMLSVSPLHDKDLMENGDLKKAHFHVIIRFAKATATPYKAYLSFVRIFGEDSFAFFEPVDDLGRAIRYHTHKGIKNKAQYSQDDIKDFGGINSSVYFYDDVNENSTIRELTRIILECNYTHWIEIYRHVVVYGLSDLENALNTNRNVKDSIFKILRDNEYINRCGLDGFYQVSQIVDNSNDDNYNSNCDDLSYKDLIVDNSNDDNYNSNCDDLSDKDLFLGINYRLNR